MGQPRPLVELRTMSGEDVAECARLLAQRHRQRRRAEALLPERFENESEARRALRAVMQEATGVLAAVEGRVAGYILVQPSVAGEPWPRSAWVPLAGHAARSERLVEVYLSLYARVAAGLVESGLLDHYVVVPASDTAAVRAWFSLGFGKEQVHAIRALPSADEGSAVPRGVDFRRAESDDLDAVTPLIELIARHQAAAPVFAHTDPEALASLRAGHAELLRDASTGYWIATENGDVLSYCVMVPAPETMTDMGVPPRCAELAVAATVPEARGRGVGTALARRALGWAGAQGYRSCIADWRSANVQASRAWERLGFRATEYRLHRTIDARAAPRLLEATEAFRPR